MDAGAFTKAALVVGSVWAAWRYKWAKDAQVDVSLAFKYPTKSAAWLREYVDVRRRALEKAILDANSGAVAVGPVGRR